MNPAAEPAGFLWRLDPRAKLLAFAGAVAVCAGSPRGEWLPFIGYFLPVPALLLLSRARGGDMFRAFAAVAPFVVMAALPLLFMDTAEGNVLAPQTATLKALFGISCAAVLSASTPFPRLMDALEALRLPALVVEMMRLAYRYLHLLKDDALKMKAAAEARAFDGRWIWQATTVGRIAGTLFARSYDRAERVYLAMASRGYGAARTDAVWPPMGAGDWAFMAGVAGWMLLSRGTPWLINQW